MKPSFKVETIDSFPWGVIGWKEDHSILYANAAARSIFNLIGDDKVFSLHSIVWVSQLGEPLSPENHPVVQCFEKGEKIPDIVLGFSLPSENQITWIEAHCIPEFEEGNPRPVQVVFTITKAATPQGASNITSDEVKVITVRDGKYIFESDILNCIGQAVIVTDLQGNITYNNDAACTMYGWSKEEFSKKNVLDTTVPDSSDVQAKEIMEKLTKGESWTGEFSVERKDGTTFPVFITDSPIFNSKGELTGVVGVSSDISERKVFEAEKQRIHELLALTHEDLIKTNNQLSAVFDNVKDAIVVQDTEGKIIYTNRSYDEIFSIRLVK